MTPERLAALQSIGFVWANHKLQAAWDAKYKQVQDFKSQYGPCLIPQKYAKGPALGKWVSTQRVHYHLWKKGDPRSIMNAEKAKLLDSIGFTWTTLRPSRK